MYVGIDVGTQSLKAIVAGDDMRVLGTAARPYPVRHAREGWVEQDPRAWESALSPAIAEALEGARCRPTDVCAVGIAGQLDGCIAIGPDAEPLAPAIIWMDRRATLRDVELPADFRRRTGLVADPGHMAAKIAWLAPRVSAHRFHQPVSFLVERLTGEAVFDPALASTTMLYDLGTSAVAGDLCDAFGIDPRWLPRIAPANSVAGVISAAGAERCGLPAGTPVAVGTGDDFATPLGAGVTDPGTMVCVLGTAEVVGAVAEHHVIDEEGLVETHGFVAGRYFVENPGWLAGGAVAWARALFGFASDAELDAAAADAPPGSAGVVFLPALTGAMAPAWRPDARGCFYGLTPGHDRGHLARAVLEGCAFAMRDVQRRLVELGVAPTRVLALGGGAASDVWLQLRADLCGQTVAGAEHGDSCALGAAVLAASGIEGAAIRDVAARVELPTRTFEANAELHEAYHRAYASYRALWDALDPMVR